MSQLEDQLYAQEMAVERFLLLHDEWAPILRITGPKLNIGVFGLQHGCLTLSWQNSVMLAMGRGNCEA